jgi:hypothetical protein
MTDSKVTAVLSSVLSKVQDNPRILLAGRHHIAISTIILESLLVIEGGIYTPHTYISRTGF